MPKESVIFGIAGVFFGVICGWIIGSQQAAAPRTAEAPPPQQAASGSARQSAAPRLDEARTKELQASAERSPRDAAPRVELANLYFDAERFEEAARWYEEVLKIDPRNANVSTDLGISYYYMNQADRALGQFERSLAIDPKHSKTWLNIGVVRAFGKEDLDGAAKAWQRVLAIAPDSAEGQRARQLLEGLRTAHPAPPAGSAPDKPKGSSN
jgi:tetratricopeptide (TPR) repeat protein